MIPCLQFKITRRLLVFKPPSRFCLTRFIDDALLFSCLSNTLMVGFVPSYE